jgi:hypothetical protein
MGLGRCLLASFTTGPRAAALWCALLLASIDASVYSDSGVQCNIAQSVLVSCSCPSTHSYPSYTGNETLLWTCSPCRARRAQPTSNRLTYG